MSMSLAASGAAHAAHSALIVAFDAPDASAATRVGATVPARDIIAQAQEAAQRADAAARPDGVQAKSAGPAPGEKMAEEIQRHTARDVIVTAEAKLLQAMLEAADRAAAPTAVGGADRPVGREDGPKELTDARGMARQITDQKRATELFEAQIMEMRDIADGRAASKIDLRA